MRLTRRLLAAAAVMAAIASMTGAYRDAAGASVTVPAGARAGSPAAA